MKKAGRKLLRCGRRHLGAARGPGIRKQPAAKGLAGRGKVGVASAASPPPAPAGGGKGQLPSDWVSYTDWRSRMQLQQL